MNPPLQFDLAVVGGTPGGISCALRGAREGLRVVLIEASAHFGGMWASGVQVFDTRYAGHRCPVLAEFTARLADHYCRTSGEGSPDHVMAQYGDPSKHGERPRFEPHVAEAIFRAMLADTRGLRVLERHRVESVEKAGSVLRELRVRPPTGGLLRVGADIFVDATYEADLAALGGAAFRSGREGRDEFGEPHAGRHFTTVEPIGEAGQALARRLNLHFFNRTSRRQFPASTGHGDGAVQAYSTRLVLTNRADNRVPVPRPAAYSRERYLGILDRSADAHTRPYPLSSHLLHGSLEHMRLAANMPNGKMDWLGANLVGGNHEYPHATLPRRAALYRAHLDHALGLLHFLQDDPAVPAGLREHLREWGLARDEYPDHGHCPPMMYVREARRLAGLHVFTEHDASRHPRHERTPIHPDAIAFAEWPMDSHDCNPVRQAGSFNDGEFILAETTLPSQVPFRCLLTEAADNLLVPVAMSATHVGWGTLRLEPVFIHTGEAAAVAAALSLRDNVPLRALRGSTLQPELLQRRIAVTHFADVDVGSDEPWVQDAQYLATRGFFPGYDAHPGQSVTPALATAWHEVLHRWVRGEDDPNLCAAHVAASLRPGAAPSPAADSNTAGLLRRHGWNDGPPPTVQLACRALSAALREAESAGLSA